MRRLRSDIATSQGKLAATRISKSKRWLFPESLPNSVALLTPSFWTSSLKAVRKLISVALSPQGCTNLLEQPQEMNPFP